MAKLRDHIFGLCTLLFCLGLPFSTDASANCHDMEVATVQTSASTHQAFTPPLSGSLEDLLSASTQPESATHASDSHDCCDGNMSHCPMAQCAGTYYTNTFFTIPSTASRPKVYFQPLRTGVPKRPKSTVFRPPILS